MNERSAGPLQAMDVATLLPQLRRLRTEIVALRPSASIASHPLLATAGLGNLPRLRRHVTVAARTGRDIGGVAVIRELAGGSAWEVVSARLAREKDDDTVEALLASAGDTTATLGGRMLFIRFAESSPHESAIRRSGLIPYAAETLYAPPPATSERRPGPFRPVERNDRHGIFRLYCRAVPEVVRRNEAITQPEFRSLLDTFAITSEWVVEANGTIVAWAGAGPHEARLLDAGDLDEAIPRGLDLARTYLSNAGALVLGEHQQAEHRVAVERGYTPLGTRRLAARRLALLNPLKEAVAVPAASRVPN